MGDGAWTMDTQRLSIKGRIVRVDDAALQSALAEVYETLERPRCLCVPGASRCTSHAIATSL